MPRKRKQPPQPEANQPARPLAKRQRRPRQTAQQREQMQEEVQQEMERQIELHRESRIQMHLQHMELRQQRDQMQAQHIEELELNIDENRYREIEEEMERERERDRQQKMRRYLLQMRRELYRPRVVSPVQPCCFGALMIKSIVHQYKLDEMRRICAEEHTDPAAINCAEYCCDGCNISMETMRKACEVMNVQLVNHTACIRQRPVKPKKTAKARRPTKRQPKSNPKPK